MGGEANITSPVMRLLAVSDVARSTAFYRDVLGFEVSGNEANSGPARIRFEKDVPQAAVLFFQIDDVAAKHAAIARSGGAPGAMEKVNWIKMRMFEVRDPDGNVLSFGQTYHVEQDSPSRRDSQPKGMRQALPELPFDNVPAAIAYYCNVLGFHVNYQQDDLGVLDRDSITILLIPRTGQHKGVSSFGVYIDDADALYAELLAKGARLQGTPVSHP